MSLLFCLCVCFVIPLFALFLVLLLSGSLSLTSDTAHMVV